jgi:cation:H+ antiporter
VGSSIFNLLGILGLAAVAGGGLELPQALVASDLPIMVGVALALVPLLARAHRLDRITGAFFLAYYAAYVTYLALSAKQHAALAGFTAVMAEVVLPLTVAGLIAWGYARRAGRSPVRAPETT